MTLNGVIALILDPEILISRITARRTCSSCGKIVNLLVDTLPDEEVCPDCAGVLGHRDDDNETVVRKRIEGYRHETAPLLSYYQDHGILYPVDGLGPVLEVEQRVTEVLHRIETDAAERRKPVWEDKENI